VFGDVILERCQVRVVFAPRIAQLSFNPSERRQIASREGLNFLFAQPHHFQMGSSDGLRELFSGCAAIGHLSG
jgi:hypothetical protein